MYKPEDIVILGDSFAYDRSQPYDWPLVLTELLTGIKTQCRGAGYKGASWWSVRNKLLNEITVAIPKILIICHTDAYRLPNDHDFGITLGILDRDDIVSNTREMQDKNHTLTVAKEFYKHLFCKEFMEWSAIQWYKQLDQLIIQHNIPFVIHLWCFKKLYDFNQGMYCEDNLFHLSSIHDKDSKIHSRNHFHERENVRLAHGLANALSNYHNATAISELLPKVFIK
jgi:hypothetical protein